MITFKWELTDFNGETILAFGTEVPCAKKEGVFYPDTSNLNAICAFSPCTNETMTVEEFRTVQNLFCGGWHEKVNEGWTLVKSFKVVDVIHTDDSIGDNFEAMDEDRDEDDDYWG